MKQKILIGVFVIILCGIILISNQSLGVTYSEGYTIKNYDINMIVGKDNVFDITENITVNFNSARHGISREILLYNTITEPDGTSSFNRVKITDINVSESYDTYDEVNCKVIKIGNEDSTITGIHNYTIKYKYNIGKDYLKNADGLHFNLIRGEWDVNIENVSFTIKMPKFFDQSSLRFSSGKLGYIDSSNITYSVNENESIITGNTVNTLKPGERLTVELTLPEGYFSRARSHDAVYNTITIIFSLACVFIAYILWNKYGKNDKIIDTVEFFPPEGYNPVEVALLYKGYVNDKNIISLLIYLANKGYLKIEEVEIKRILTKKKDIKLTKLKEYDGCNKNECIFFKRVFRFKDTVYISDLDYRFYPTVKEIKYNLNSEENRNKIFDSSAIKKRKWLIMMMIAVFTIITIKPVSEHINSYIDVLYIGIILIELVILIKFFKIYSVFLIIVCLSAWISIVIPEIFQDSSYRMVGIVGIICIFIILGFTILMKKRTPYGLEMLGKIKGFKKFLKNAEKSRLEILVEEKPEYFFDILPYAYVLGVSDVWIKKFEIIVIKSPNWCRTKSHDFDINYFRSYINRTMTSSKHAIRSRHVMSSRKYSGGGSSGGDSEGDGGGSW